MASSAWEEQQYGSELEHPETDRIAADQGEEGDHIVYTKDVQDLKGKLDKFLRSNDLYSKVRDIIKERNMVGFHPICLMFELTEKALLLFRDVNTWSYVHVNTFHVDHRKENRIQ